MQQEHTRAPKGGITGKNGERYEGGQFLPASARTIKGEMGSKRKRKPARVHKVEIAPYEWVERPEGAQPIYARLSGVYARVNRETGMMEANINPVTLKYYGDTEEEILALVDRWNAGERWL